MISKWTQGWRRQRERRKETKTLTRRNDLEMRIIRCKHRADIPRLGKFVQCVQVGFWVHLEISALFLKSAKAVLKYDIFFSWNWRSLFRKITSPVCGNCSKSRFGRLLKTIFSLKWFLMASNLLPLVPQRAILSPIKPRSLRSKWTRATTPRDLSLLEPSAPVHPVTYSPVPKITAFIANSTNVTPQADKKQLSYDVVVTHT